MTPQMRAAILSKDLMNEIALNANSTAEQLENELDRLNGTEDVETLLPATVQWRVEESGYSWKVEAEDYLSELQHGHSMPPLGKKFTDSDGTSFVVVDYEAGLTIRALDLEVREKFDPRRIYTSRTGNKVVYKRTDPGTGKPVLWCYEQSIEIVIGKNTELVWTTAVAKPIAAVKRVMTQKVLSAYLIAQNPDITNNDLTDALREAFPQSTIVKGGRQGAHYKSLSRTGNLPEAPDSDPRLWNK